MNYYEEIKNKIIDYEIYCKVKNYSKGRNTINTYFEIDRLLTEAGGKYGDNVIEEYSKRLVKEVGKKYNSRTLRRIRQFYKRFSNENWSPLATNLTWSHYTELLSIKDKNKLLYYLNLASNNNLSRNELRSRIKSKEYERLSESAKSKLIANEKLLLSYLVKNPILIKITNQYTEISEKILHHIKLENMAIILLKNILKD